MTIYLSDKKRYKKSDSYGKKMTYTTTLFNGSYDDYKAICKNPVLSKKCVIWYRNHKSNKKR